MTTPWVAAGAGALAALHVIGARLRFVSYVPRSGWLSFAGGISVAYVFVHLLPEVAAGADLVERQLRGGIASEHVVWLTSLVGMVVFYGIEVASRGPSVEAERRQPPSAAVYGLSVTAYGIYNAVIAYQLHDRVEQGLVPLVLFVVAMALHFLVNDFALREHHKQRYDTAGRWILVGAIGVGAVIGGISDVSRVAIELTSALIAGGVVLNTLKEELPTQAESRFSAFLGGTVSYAALLLTL